MAGALAAYHESANNMLMPIRKARDFFVAAVALMRRLQKKFEDDRQAAEECNTFAVPWAIKDLAEKSILAKSKNPRINIRNKRDGVVHVHPDRTKDKKFVVRCNLRSPYLPVDCGCRRL